MPQPERTGAGPRARIARAFAAAAILLAASRPCLAAQTPAPGRIRKRATSALPPCSPVLIDGEPVLWITGGRRPVSHRPRRAHHPAHHGSRPRSQLRDPTVTVTEADGSSELRAGPRLLMVVTPRTRRASAPARASVALQHAQVIEQAIRAERLRYAPSTLLSPGSTAASPRWCSRPWSG